MEIERWNRDDEDEPTEERLRERLESRGYDVSRYTYPPGMTLSEHTHSVDEIDAVLEGRFRIEMDGESVVLEAGDWVHVPAGIPHAAEVVGDESVVSLDATRR
jgi:quercetin dioxygenase-like cupin family protein